MHDINRKVICCFVAFIFFFQSFALASARVDEIPFDIHAKSALLLDATTGKILFSKNPDEKLPVASVTKVMTILLLIEALDKGQLTKTDTVKISEHASGMGGSQVYLAPNETFPIDELMKAIVIASANDASVAMAEKLCGSEELFVEKMNERAKQLGMQNTNFLNCTGLPIANNYSSASDIAIMSRELLKHPTFFSWSTIWLDHIRNGKTLLTNTNRLVRFYDGADGIKTGSTNEALFCLSATAKRGNLRLISIIIAAPTSKVRFAEAQKMMDYGFANYQIVVIVKKNEEIKKQITIINGNIDHVTGISKDEYAILLKKDENKTVEKKINVPNTIRAPIKKGQTIGDMTLYKEGKQIGKVVIITNQDVLAASLWDNMNKIIKRWIGK